MEKYEPKSIFKKIYDGAVYVASAAILVAFGGCENSQREQQILDALKTAQRARYSADANEPVSHDQFNNLVRMLVNTPGSNYPTYDAAIPFVRKGADYNGDGEVSNQEFGAFVTEHAWIIDEYEASKNQNKSE